MFCYLGYKCCFVFCLCSSSEVIDKISGAEDEAAGRRKRKNDQSPSSCVLLLCSSNTNHCCIVFQTQMFTGWLAIYLLLIYSCEILVSGKCEEINPALFRFLVTYYVPKLFLQTEGCLWCTFLSFFLEHFWWFATWLFSYLFSIWVVTYWTGICCPWSEWAVILIIPIVYSISLPLSVMFSRSLSVIILPAVFKITYLLSYKNILQGLERWPSG